MGEWGNKKVGAWGLGGLGAWGGVSGLFVGGGDGGSAKQEHEKGATPLLDPRSHKNPRAVVVCGVCAVAGDIVNALYTIIQNPLCVWCVVGLCSCAVATIQRRLLRLMNDA